MTAAAPPCIGEPISWLRLELFALDANPADPAVTGHLAACPACQQCLDQIRTDAIALPPLVAPSSAVPSPTVFSQAVPSSAAPSPAVPSPTAPSPTTPPPGVAPPGVSPLGAPPLTVPPLAPRPAWRRRWVAPAFAAAAAVVILVVVLRPAPAPSGDAFGPVAIKGIGEIALELVRERGGAIAVDARRYTHGDRWKIVVSCPPAAGPAMLALDVSVGDGAAIDHPLAAAWIACGNRVVVPGAFAITGDRPNRVCVRIGAAPGPVDPDTAATACATLVPEPAPEPAR